jgi:hypothetical protein
VSITPFSTWLPVPNHGGPMSSHLGLILHVQQGNGGLQGWFSNPSSQVSSTWWVSKTGAIQQYVDTDLTAWAQGNGNATYNSVETEGFDTEPLTQAQIQGVAQIYAWGMGAYGWPDVITNVPGIPGLGTHAMGGAPWSNHPGCPGALRTPQRQAILNAITQPPKGAEMQVAATPSGKGYVCVTADGAVFAYGDAIYDGGPNTSKTATGWNGPPDLPSGDTCTDVAYCALGGYWISTAQENLYAYGNAAFLGKP